MQLAADERSDLADLLESLAPEQWERPSLCEAWTIHDVVAHIISYEELSYLGVAAAFVRGGFRPGRINEQRLAAYREHTPEQLIEILRSHLRPHGLTAGSPAASASATASSTTKTSAGHSAYPAKSRTNDYSRPCRSPSKPPSFPRRTTRTDSASSPPTSTGNTATAPR